MNNCKKTSSENVDFKALVVMLDLDLSIRDGDEHAFYAQFNTMDTIKNIIVYYENNVALGCGAIKKYDSATAEIKRIFVVAEHRGKGIALAVLTALELWAKELGYTNCILETGINQPEAIGLYQKAKYEIIPNYGQYENVENSVCMRKSI